MKFKEAELNKDYWYFDLRIATSGRCTRLTPPVKVNLKRHTKPGDTSLYMESVEHPGKIVKSYIWGPEEANLYDTWEEAKTEWNRIIQDNIDRLTSVYEKTAGYLRNKMK